ncbi:fucolectin [Nematostella vectensis]|uniref:fucolectin n=1 Tax=Nematostella vectensis TaxID=45351 RepID=UPI00138FFEA4|nr:fucolectin [Nematostella vectensis]
MTAILRVFLVTLLFLVLDATNVSANNRSTTFSFRKFVVRNTKVLLRGNAELTKQLRSVNRKASSNGRGVTELSKQLRTIKTKTKSNGQGLTNVLSLLNTMKKDLAFVKTRVTPCSKGVSSTNVALHKPASQSSISWYGSAGRAVDGSRNGKYFDGSCSHTNVQFNPWWRVDLRRSFLVRRVFVMNRQDCCGNALNNFEVRVGDSTYSMSDPTCGTSYSIPQGQGLTITCRPPLRGRYVTIMLHGQDRVLTLCEVEVYPCVE